MEAIIGKRFAYVRTSTTDQINGLDAQVDAVLRHDPDIDRRDIYLEQTSGGLHHSKRPQLHALLNQLQSDDIVYTHRIDRIGRSTLDLLKIIERIKKAGARFISIADGIDTQSGIVADVFLTVLSSIATYERALVSERTKSSLKVLKDRGIKLGRPTKITPTLVRQVQTLHDDSSISVTDVCSCLGISQTSYYTALRQTGDLVI
jgi:DNA invertase Pin-like site-specific DNA recombinase